MTPDWTGYLRFRPFFARVIEPRDLLKLDGWVREGRAQVWVGRQAAIVTEIAQDDRGDFYIDTLAVGGDRTEIVETLRPIAEGCAQSLGCTYAFADGRKGWQRVLGKHGYVARGFLPRAGGIRKDL